MPSVTAARYVTFSVLVTPRNWKRPGAATAASAIEVVRSKSVAVAPPCREPRVLKRGERLWCGWEGVKRKRVVLRMPWGEGLVLVARCCRWAWKGVS